MNSRRRRRRRLLKICVPLFTIVSLLLLLELAAEVVWRAGPWSATSRWVMVNYYLLHERRIAQFDDCAEFDSDLTYRLRPGTHRFVNREFDTQFSVNELGLRDDDQSAIAPEVIVLGDSFAMGWGVEDGETFEAVLQSTSGLRTLNAAISSYGTARQMTMLNQLDRSSLQYVILQYCSNDYEENIAYADDWNLETITERQYLQARYDYRQAVRYYPLKRTLKLLPIFWDKRHGASDPGMIPGPRPATAHDADQAHLLCRVLAHCLDELGGDFKVILIHLDYPQQLDDGVMQRVDSLLQKPEHAVLKERLFMVRATQLIDADDYYELDLHLTATGHRKVGVALAGAVGQLKSTENLHP